ncbi:hypothetical protein [Siphonobacter sp. BAB-5385]|uniref:hypothetical protein n=1 Tax=Siphonobacter sp. BAB-5385 TaxID=1864822 RepID=UPI0011404AB6|nr:hypothetical protein [Siphonobacter sp. BAB-5385]
MNKKLLLILLFISSICNSQTLIVDRNGENVFSYYQGGTAKFSFTTGDPSGMLTYVKPLRRYYYYVDRDTTHKTVGIARGISASFSVKTTDKQFFLQNPAGVKPSYELSLGYQQSIDKFYNIDRISKLSNHLEAAIAWGVNVFAKIDDVNLYQISTLSESREYPKSIGLNTHWSRYKNRWWVFSISGKGEYTWNTDKLNKYQNNTPIYVDDKIIVLDDFRGLYGDFKRQWNFRYRVSSIFIPFSYIEDSDLQRLGITPYFVQNFYGKKSEFIYGVSINFFGERIKGKNYNFAEGFGLGFDWNSQFSKTHIFLSGTINFGKVKDSDYKNGINK